MNSDDIFDHIDQIAQVSSTKLKKRMLIPELAQVLEYTYDPFRTYGIKQFTGGGRIDGKQFDENVWHLLDHLAARNLTGKQATVYVNAFMTNLSHKSAYLLAMILRKDLRCGISIKSVNDLFPDLIKDAITMQPNPYVSKLATYPLLSSLKLRGCRGYYRDGMLLSRRGKMYKGLDHIINELKIFGTHFDGELLVPGIPFETGSGMIRSDSKTPQAVYCVFDTPDDSIYRFQDRYELYKQMIRSVKNSKIVTHFMARNEKQLYKMFRFSLKAGFEGVVAKDPISYYKPGYTNSWWKLKELMDNLDLPVIDIYEGEGKYQGQLGGVVVEHGFRRVNVGGGFSDPERIKFWKNPNLIIGMTIEVEAQERTNKGSLRNPIYKGIRDDK